MNYQGGHHYISPPKNLLCDSPSLACCSLFRICHHFKKMNKLTIFTLSDLCFLVKFFKEWKSPIDSTPRDISYFVFFFHFSCVHTTYILNKTGIILYILCCIFSSSLIYLGYLSPLDSFLVAALFVIPRILNLFPYWWILVHIQFFNINNCSEHTDTSVYIFFRKVFVEQSLHTRYFARCCMYNAE